MAQHIYILMCADRKLYVGCTENLEEKLMRHQGGHVPATKARLPVELVTYVTFQDKYKAYTFEKYLKSGSGRAFTNKHLI